LWFSDPGDELPVGEVAWATVIRSALEGRPPRYVRVCETSLRELLEKEAKQDSRIWVLDERGNDLESVSFAPRATENSFILGDHIGFDSQTLEVISQMGIPKISLGSRSYLGSHCIAMVISHFERTA